MAKEMIAMLLAGGQGSRLYASDPESLQSLPFRLVESTGLSISRFPIVSIPGLIQ